MGTRLTPRLRATRAAPLMIKRSSPAQGCVLKNVRSSRDTLDLMFHLIRCTTFTPKVLYTDLNSLLGVRQTLSFTAKGPADSI